MGLFSFLKKASNVQSLVESKSRESEYQKAIRFLLEEFNYDSVESILSIEIPTDIPDSFNGNPSHLPEKILNKRASEFKKLQQMDLAIACLKKANEFAVVSPYPFNGHNYYRLIDFLKQNRNFDEARREKMKLDEYFEQLTADTISFHEYKMHRIKSSGTDLVEFSVDNPNCPLCSLYEGRIFSLSGKDSTFPPFSELPDILKTNDCEICGLPINFNAFFDFSPEYNKKVKLSEKPIKDRRTKQQRTEFEKAQKEANQEEIDRKEYDYLWEFMPEICPKSYNGYRRMKNSKSANFQKIVSAAAEKGFNITIL